MWILIILLSLAQIIQGKITISIYADVHKDREFFKTTYPWIVANIGGEIEVDYYLLGSGRHSIPQMCTLEQLRNNPYLQAQYLQCTAEDNPSIFCLCLSGVNSDEFKTCVRNGGYLASNAASFYALLNLDTTPIVELGFRTTVFQVSETWYLKKICTMFGEFPPLGCMKPSASNMTESTVDKWGLAQFDKECILPPTSEETKIVTTPLIPVY